MKALRHVIEAQQFDVESLEAIFTTAREMEQVVQHYGSNILNRRVMATLFYEPIRALDCRLNRLWRVWEELC